MGLCQCLFLCYFTQDIIFVYVGLGCLIKTLATSSVLLKVFFFFSKSLPFKDCKRFICMKLARSAEKLLV